MQFFHNDSLYYFLVGRVKPKEDCIDNVTGYTLSGIPEGLIVVVLEDEYGVKSHTIGITRGFNVMYDCMETHEIQLNHEILSK